MLLSHAVALFDGWFPPSTAMDFDAVGLVYGDPTQPVGKVMFAVDPTIEVAREAADWGADLLVVHHPLFLRPVHGFAATTPKGRTIATLIKADCALLTVHTNGDRATPGVSDAMAAAFGLTDTRPIEQVAGPGLDKLTVYVPTPSADAVRGAISAAGAGAIGDYDMASFCTPGEGRFRPLAGATPAIGEVGSLEVVDEVRIEAVLPRSRRSAVVAAMLAVHPYEEPAYDVVEVADPGTGFRGSAPGRLAPQPTAAGGLAPQPTAGGAGRVGTVPETTLGEFAALVCDALPATPRGVLVGGDPDRPVRTVAVCGGAGDFLLDQVRRVDADVYVTSDLRHHPAIEFLEQGGPALIDVPHWAAEWTWLPAVERQVRAATDLETRVSTLCTDAWTLRR